LVTVFAPSSRFPISLDTDIALRVIGLLFPSHQLTEDINDFAVLCGASALAKRLSEHERVIKCERSALTYRCRYPDENSMLFFNINGVDMPCCSIKKVDQYESREHSE
jgi:hypothetical protein